MSVWLCGGAVLLAQNVAAQHATYTTICLVETEPQRLIKACSQVVRNEEPGPNISWAHNNLGNVYRNLGRLRQATVEYSIAVKLDPLNSIAFANRGNTLVELGDLRLAVADLSVAIELDPKNPAYFNSRGVAQARGPVPGPAIDDFTRAIELDPNNVDALQNRGNSYLDSGEITLAIADFETALIAFADDPLLLNGLAWALYLSGRPADALAASERSVAALPQTFNIDTLAHILTALGRTEEAMEQFTRAMEVGGEEQVFIYQQALAARGYLPFDTISGALTEMTRTGLAACIEDRCRLVE